MKPINILLIEDDDADAKAVIDSLQAAKIVNQLCRAVDGIEALEILRGTHHKEKLLSPFILLVDLKLPRMDGISFIRELREDPRLHKSIVFVLTTSWYDHDKAQAYDLNIAGFIVKEKLGGNFENLTKFLGYYSLLVDLPT